ncbi:MAG: MFS transporter [Kiritimatiellae bacterium]|nr:MFS transporter [Kiritimatiellia bacterium]
MSETRMTKFRWVMCTLLFVATTVNYLDRQVLSLTFPDFIRPEFHWSDADYGTITAWFSLIYAASCLFAGKFVDWMGTKKGYLWAIFVWSLGACLHAGCDIATCFFVDGVSKTAELVKATGDVAAAVAGVSVWLFLGCRAVLALGEAGNFPAAIKVTAEYFPKKDRAFATSIFNAGASVGALAAPLTIPVLAKWFGWQMAFIIIGGAGFIWMFFWQWLYTKPQASKFVDKAELAYISQDEAAEPAAATTPAAAEEKPISFLKCFTFRQTWSFIVGKFFTDGVWWFYLFWAPAYFKEQGHGPTTGMGQALIFTLYLIVTVVSIYGCKLPTFFINKGMMGGNPYMCRMRAMLIFAFFPLAALITQPLAGISVWFPAVLIGLAAAGHQAWSANIFSTVGDMFPKSTIASVTGMGAMAGGVGSFIINKCAGSLFTYAETQGAAFTFCGFAGKPAGYMIVFCCCAVAYLVAWTIMKTLVPKYSPIKG